MNERAPLLVPSFLQPASVAMYLLSGVVAVLVLMMIIEPAALLAYVDFTFVAIWALLMLAGAFTALQGSLSANLGDQQRSWLESWGAAVVFFTWTVYVVSLLAEYGLTVLFTVLLSACVAAGSGARSVQCWASRRKLRAAARTGEVTHVTTLADPKDRGVRAEEV